MKKNSAICVLAAKAVPSYADKMFTLAGRIRRGRDGEAIHDMRVARRRLRAALNTFGQCFSRKDANRWLRQTKGVTKALGEARDLDVQILAVRRFLERKRSKDVQAGMERLLLRLQRERQMTGRALVAAVTRFAQSAACDELRRVGGGASRPGRAIVHDQAMCRTASEAIGRRLADLLAYADDVNGGLNTDRLHAMRIEAKKLRYTMELTSRLYGRGLSRYINAVRKMQTTLGDLHDCAVWIEFLPRFIERERQLSIEYCGSDAELAGIEAGAREFGRYCQQRMEGHYAKFVRMWKRCQKNGLWTELSNEKIKVSSAFIRRREEVTRH